MSVPRPSLPEYAHPPLVAATLGVFGSALNSPGQLMPACTEFQRQLGPEWLGDWKEPPEDNCPQRDVGLLHAGRELSNVLGDRVLRVSEHHFAFTWLGAEDGRYPRYENLRDGFVAAWDIWSLPHGRQPSGAGEWCVCYLNRIPQGTVWQTPTDWSFVKLFPGGSQLGAGRLDAASWRLQIPEITAGLSVDWSVDAAEETVPNIWLRLTARGKLTQSLPNLLDGMDAGRAAIVQTFSELMSPAANAYWGLRRREK